MVTMDFVTDEESKTWPGDVCVHVCVHLYVLVNVPVFGVFS